MGFSSHSLNDIQIQLTFATDCFLIVFREIIPMIFAIKQIKKKSDPGTICFLGSMICSIVLNACPSFSLRIIFPNKDKWIVIIMRLNDPRKEHFTKRHG